MFGSSSWTVDNPGDRDRFGYFLLSSHVLLAFFLLLNSRRDLDIMYRSLPLLVMTPLYIGCLAWVSVELIQFYDDNVGSYLSPRIWQWHFWLMLEVTIPLCMSCSSGIFLMLHHIFPETFIQTQWNLHLRRSYRNLGKIDYLNLHLEEIFLFNIHVAPFFINYFLCKFDPSTLKGHESQFKHVVFDPIWYLSAINGAAYIVYNFMPLRKPRKYRQGDGNVSPYSGEGWFGTFKRMLFLLCILINTVVVPVLALEWIIHQGAITDLNENIYSEWMFTFVYLTFMPMINMFYNFRQGTFDAKKWHRVLT